MSERNTRDRKLLDGASCWTAQVAGRRVADTKETERDSGREIYTERMK